ncbi:hypothetical protein MTR67_033079 [Solanum verrucosum]|uniref:Yippee domain-containing protein n=1 Tax=Solanum verrucosum TaxID=315347 RepID=A0AAF0ZJU3_SOLVR|nr:hypothetical protein MTR67_033079 [Solanum verrucosum]
MGRLFLVDLEGKTYNCKFCKTQLGQADDLVSKAFHCRSGKAYLFNNVCKFQWFAHHQHQLVIFVHDYLTWATFGYSVTQLSKVYTVHAYVCMLAFFLPIYFQDFSFPGLAWLSRWVNITFGQSEERTMLSGKHTVIDIFCCCCGQILGWKYEKAHEKSQKYKEGKFVLERGMIIDGEVDSEFYIDTRASTSDGEDTM